MGTSDTTALVESGGIGWQLNPGAHPDLNLTLKYATATGCDEDLLTFGTSSDTSDTQVFAYVHLPIAA